MSIFGNAHLSVRVFEILQVQVLENIERKLHFYFIQMISYCQRFPTASCQSQVTTIEYWTFEAVTGAIRGFTVASWGPQQPHILASYDFFPFSVLDLSVDNDLFLAERQMQAMAKVLHKLICDGMHFYSFEYLSHFGKSFQWYIFSPYSLIPWILYQVPAYQYQLSTAKGKAFQSIRSFAQNAEKLTDFSVNIVFSLFPSWVLIEL